MGANDHRCRTCKNDWSALAQPFVKFCYFTKFGVFVNPHSGRRVERPAEPIIKIKAVGVDPKVRRQQIALRIENMIVNHRIVAEFVSISPHRNNDSPATFNFPCGANKSHFFTTFKQSLVMVLSTQIEGSKRSIQRCARASSSNIANKQFGVSARS